jgi:SAM-dependent methyltransferase
MFLSLATSSAHRLASWFDTPPGRRLLAEQGPSLEEAARRFHGDTLLWAGCHTASTDTVSGCMIRHRLFVTPHSLSLASESAADAATDSDKAEADAQRGRDLALTRASLHALPLRNNAVDAVVLHHALETADDPRTALREVARVLAPGGRLLVCGFNPWSLLRLRTVYGRLRPDSFSRLRLVSPGRLADWLTVLGFEQQGHVSYLAYGLPFWTQPTTAEGEPTLWGKLNARLVRSRLPVGGVYLVSAVKQAMALRPDLKPVRVRAPGLAGVAYPKLSAWNRVDRDR